MSNYWRNHRFVVTGGAGFLGGYVVSKMQKRGALEIQVPHAREYDLRRVDDIRRMYDDMRPDVVIHLAASVGESERTVSIPAASSTTT